MLFRSIKKINQNHFEITRYVGPHSCVSLILSQDHSGLDSNLIASEVLELVRKELRISIAEIVAVVKFNYMPSYRKLWIGKKKAMARVFGDWDMSYHMLPKWLCEVQQFNPGTFVHYLYDTHVTPGCATFDRAF